MLLCKGHHRARHRGQLIIEGRHPDFTFKLRDGTVVEDPEREAKSEGHASREATPAASLEAGAIRRELDETVVAALQKLEMKPREATRAVRRARERLTEPPGDVPSLLAAALRFARAS